MSTNFAILSENTTAHVGRRPRRNFTRKSTQRKAAQPLPRKPLGLRYYQQREAIDAVTALHAKLASGIALVIEATSDSAFTVGVIGTGVTLEAMQRARQMIAWATPPHYRTEKTVMAYAQQPITTLPTGDFGATVTFVLNTPTPAPVNRPDKQHYGRVYQYADQRAAANDLPEVLWAVGVLHFSLFTLKPNGLMVEGEACQVQLAAHMLQDLLKTPVETKQVTLTAPPRWELCVHAQPADKDDRPNLKSIYFILSPENLAETVAARHHCDALTEVPAIVRRMTGRELAELLIDAHPALAKEQWASFCERLLDHADAMKDDLFLLVYDEVMECPAVTADQPPHYETL